MDRLRLRSSLTAEEQNALLRLPFEKATVRGNRDLVTLGEQTDASYLVVSGVIGRFSQMRSRVRQIVALHIAGEMADLCSVVLAKTSWAFHAFAPTTVLRIAHSDLITVADQYPNVAQAFGAIVWRTWR